MGFILNVNEFNYIFTELLLYPALIVSRVNSCNSCLMTFLGQTAAERAKKVRFFLAEWEKSSTFAAAFRKNRSIRRREAALIKAASGGRML